MDTKIRVGLPTYLPEGWQVGLETGSLRLIAPKMKAVHPFLELWLDEVRSTAEMFGCVEICSLDSPHVVPIRPSANKLIKTTAIQERSMPAMSTLHIESPIPMSLGLARALTTIAERPEEQWFLHRISPDLNKMTQIAVSESAASLIIGATPRQALNRDRRDYVYPRELERLKQVMRQDMSLGSSLETRWLGFSPATGKDSRRFFYEYSIVDALPDGSVIQLGKCLGVEPIAEPAIR